MSASNSMHRPRSTSRWSTESSVDSTLIQLINPSTTETTWFNLGTPPGQRQDCSPGQRGHGSGWVLHGDHQGNLQTRVPSSEGFVAAKATKAISGYEVVASQEKSLTGSSGRRASSTQRLGGHTCFADPDRETSVVRVLNAGTQIADSNHQRPQRRPGETMTRNR